MKNLGKGLAISGIVVGFGALMAVFAMMYSGQFISIAESLFNVPLVEADSLSANAGPDQTVPGPGPVSVQFDGTASTGEIISYKWYNQWGLLRGQGESPTFEVNFGNDNPQPGTKRTFTLIIEDAHGNVAKDKVTVTLGENEEEPTSDQRTDPAIGSMFTGTLLTYRNASLDTIHWIETGLLTGEGQVKWYVASTGVVNDDRALFANVECHQGTHWEADTDSDGAKDAEGCVGPAGSISLTVKPINSGFEVYVVLWPDSESAEDHKIATITPQVDEDVQLTFANTAFEQRKE